MSQPPQQPGQWGGQSDYGQQPYGPPGGYPPGGGFGQPRKKSALPWILAGGGVVVVAVAVILIVTLTGSDTASPEDVAEAAVSAANGQDVDAIQELLCSDVQADESDVTEAIRPEGSGVTGVTFELGEVTESGDTAKAVVNVTVSDLPTDAPEGTPTGYKAGIDLKKAGGDWCLVGITPPDGSGGGGADGKVFDESELEEGVRSVLADEYVMAVDDVDCPADQEVAPNSTFDCVATIDGEDRKVKIMVRDEQGTYEVGLPE